MALRNYDLPAVILAGKDVMTALTSRTYAPSLAGWRRNTSWFEAAGVDENWQFMFQTIALTRRFAVR